VTTQDLGANERGPQSPLPANDPREPEVRGDGATGPAREVPVVAVDMYPLNWEDPKRVLDALTCVRVTATSRRDVHESFNYLASLQNRDPLLVVSGEETVSVRLSSWDKESEYWDEELGRYEGWVSFEVTPANALALADELIRAATDAVR